MANVREDESEDTGELIADQLTTLAGVFEWGVMKYVRIKKLKNCEPCDLSSTLMAGYQQCLEDMLILIKGPDFDEKQAEFAEPCQCCAVSGEI